jgi:glycosyltransferase 2 family protein
VKLSKAQKRALRIIASIALVIGIFWFIPIHEVIESFRKVRLDLVIAAFLLNLLSAWLEGVQLWILLKRAAVPATLWDVFETKMTTRFYAQFLPSELMAASVKFYRLAEPTKQWSEVMAALVFFRVVNMGALTLLGLAFWAVEMPEGPGRWIGIVLIAMTLLLLVVHLFLSSKRVARFGKRLLQTRWFAWFKGKLVDKVKDFTNRTIVSYRMFHGSALTIILFAVVRHAVGIFSFWIVALALHVELSLLTIGWIRVVLHAIMSLPISLSGIGVREGSLVVLLAEYGVSGADAVALAFLLFVINLAQNSLGGIFELKNMIWRGPKAGNEARSGTP